MKVRANVVLWECRGGARPSQMRDGNLTVYPDFTILQPETREEVYLEHFGMMDDIEYVEKVINKLNTYIRNGIYPGVHLFITHETGKQPLNIRALDGMLKQLFCERK